PIPNLDDKTFQELFEEARALIPRYAPQWTEHNFSDPGITLIDLFAWLAEIQIYRLNRLNDQNFLKFFKILGESLQPAMPSKVDVTFSTAGLNSKPIELPKGTQVAADDPLSGEAMIFETEEDITVHPIELARILTLVPEAKTAKCEQKKQAVFCDETPEYPGPCEDTIPPIKQVSSRKEAQLIDNMAANAQNGVFYFAFGEQAGEDSRLYLGFDLCSDFPSGEVRMKIVPYELDLPTANETVHGKRPKIVPSAEVPWEYWNGENWQQMKVKDDTAAFAHDGSIVFAAPQDVALSEFPDTGEFLLQTDGQQFFWLRARIIKPGHEIPPRLDMILLNAVSAIQGKTVRDEMHTTTGLPHEVIELSEKPVLKDTLKLEVQTGIDTKDEWQEVADFDASGPEDRHYTLDLQNGAIAFGDGINGQIPPVNENTAGNIHITLYRVGGGEIGNVAAKTVNRIIAPELQCIRVENRQPASGGKDAESLNDAKNRMRRDLKKVARTVTTADIEKLALRTPGLRMARAQVLPLYHPDFPGIQMPGAVSIVVVPYALPGSGARLPMPSKGFLRTVYNYLKPKSLVASDLHVIAPEFTKASVKTQIKIEPGMRAETVRKETVDALVKFLEPVAGGIDHKGWPFGRAVYQSEIYQVIGEVAGVRCVESVSLSADRCFKLEGGNIKIPRIGLICSGKHEVEIG
ncbi:MAG: putative baseplate assembly protein, partial [bacterium]